MPEARVGKAIHTALEKILLGTALFDAVAEARQRLGTDHEVTRFDAISVGIRPFVERIDEFRRRRKVDRQLIEFALAIQQDLTTTRFYNRKALYRGILDLAYVFDEDNLALIDHKSGARFGQRTIIEQLEGYAVLAAAYFRNVRQIWLGIHWVASGDLEWASPVKTSDVNQYFLPNVLANIEAAALAVDDGPRTNPGAWCERCTHRSICPVGRELRFEPVEDDEPEPWM